MYDPLNFDGKTVLVTGGSSRVGREIGLRAADRGAAVVSADLRRDPRDAVVPTDGPVEERGSPRPGRDSFYPVLACWVLDGSGPHDADDEEHDGGGVLA